MSRARALAFLAASFSSVVWIACVGDDPATNATNAADASTSNDATSGSDATPTDAQTEDAGPPPACDLSQPFSLPTLVTELDTGNEQAIDITSDLLTAYFASSGRDGGLGEDDIWTASRTDASAPFGNITNVKELNSTVNDGCPRVSPDGLSMVFNSDRDGGLGNFDLWVARRASQAVAFGAPVNLKALNTVPSESGPFFTADQTQLWYTTRGPANLPAPALFVSAISGTTFGAPAQALGIHVDGYQDSAGVLTADQLTLYFASARPPVAGTTDIWVTHRPSTSQAFSSPTKVTELSSPASDAPLWLSPDGCQMYLVQADTAYHLYFTSKPH